MPEGRYIVVGGGLAGLMTTIKLAEAGKNVDAFSIVPFRRSHSVCAQGGINGAVNTKGEGDHPDIHLFDTLRGGDFLAEQPPVKGMCYAAPGIIYLLDRMGVPFNRTPEGLIDFRRFGGTMYNRTAFSGATTGQQMLYALDEQVRRWEAEGRVRRFESWECLSFVKDDEGTCRGIVAMDIRDMHIEAFPAEAVMFATGGPGVVYGKSTNSVINTGSCAGRAYLDGCWYGNGEFIQVHPTAIRGEDKLRLISESVRGEGGRVWTVSDGRPGLPPKGQPWYFFEEQYPKYKNLVPRDVASRAIWKVVKEMGLGVDGEEAVYLDVTHIPAETLDRKLGGVLEIYEKFRGEDPHKVPMKIYPAVHYSMGGLWCDYEANAKGDLVAASPKNQSTNVPGLYAGGEVDYAYHGGNRLGANSLLSCIYAGMIGGPAMASYAKAQKKSLGEVPSSVFDRAKAMWEERFQSIFKMQGTENPWGLHKELADTLTRESTVVKTNAGLKKADEKVRELQERWKNINVLDTGRTLNQTASFVNQLWNMFEMGRINLVCSIMRDECRGSHYKPEFDLPASKAKDPREDAEYMKAWLERDKKWRKTTIAEYAPEGPRVSYREIETPILKPEPRFYT